MCPKRINVFGEANHQLNAYWDRREVQYACDVISLA